MQGCLISDLETDGRLVTQARDPPGQRSVYIPPGDPERETYRLSTFKDFPRNVPINVCELASRGFYYTGYKDRIKCFSCGQASENWMMDDDISLARWHKQDCQLINGLDTRNVPIGAMFPNRGSLSRPPPPVIPLSSTSFTTAASTPPLNAIGSEPAISEAGESSRAELFPCLHPVNPHMRTVEARMQTYVDHANTWPAHRIQATPQELADAGMFYLGERDRVKCWYCNGGLQNWEQDDNPWEEHAKWFPMCEYLLQQKGPEYVHGLVSRFPNLRRPTLFNPTIAMSANRISRLLQLRQSASLIEPPPAAARVIIVDPREEIRERKKKVEEEMSSSELVSNARIMGFEDRVIRNALQRQLELHNCSFASMESLVDAMQSIIELPPSDVPPESGESSSANESSALNDVEEMRRLEEDRLCKVCHKELACVVLIPCGHLSCCVRCGEKTQRCPLCKEKIREKVRSFLA